MVDMCLGWNVGKRQDPNGLREIKCLSGDACESVNNAVILDT